MRTRGAKLKASVEDGICRIRHNAAAPINAKQQIANASHIVVTFNFRFGTHYGLNSDSEPSPKSAKLRHRMSRSLQKEKPPEGGSPALLTVQY
jgi:hypothetical protein